MEKVYKTEHNFTDYREMLDKLGDRIDAVTISVPDHNHAVMAAKAMKMGKHVHCQKPLTHSIWEARRLGEIAREKGVATQMGNQWTAHADMRKAAYQICAGQVGSVKEVHIWTDRPIWPQGGHPRRSSRSHRLLIGKRGWDRSNGVRTAAHRFTIRLLGVAGGNLAPVRWATWRATHVICHSWR